MTSSSSYTFLSATFSKSSAALLVLLCLISTAVAVDRSNFKKCDQASFCKRQRAYQAGGTPYSISPTSVNVDKDGGTISAVIENTRRAVKFPLTIQYFGKDTIRVKIDEESDLHKRYDLSPFSIVAPITPQPFLSQSSANHPETGAQASTTVTITTSPSKIELTLEYNPIKITLTEDGEPYFMLNNKNLFNVEHFRVEPEGSRTKRDAGSDEEDFMEDEDDEDFDDDEDAPAGEEGEAEKKPEEAEKLAEAAAGDGENEPEEDVEPNEPGMWKESFKTHSDSKPRGPESISMDMNFVGYKYIYGIPEHADRFWLKETTKTEPYRLYNLDVFEYELDETMALYGSIPWVIAHNTKRTMGVLWLNPSETWVDVDYEVGSSGGLFSSKSQDKANVRFMSESGIVDIWIMQGPTPQKALDQLTHWTGRPIMPAMWSIGYHQCRWNYRDEDDVAKVDAGFEEHDIPYDVMWLDIEHTDGKRYFTWDKVKFPTPSRMLDAVASRGRKMVTIVDPHIKVDSGYSMYNEITSANLWTKRDGNNFEGWCWPGNSGYPDFDNPAMRELWAKHFAYNKYHGSTPSLFTWNDMNEPSVFNGPEITMHKDVVTHGGWEHRHVHNLYGLHVHMATMEGQLLRNRQVEGNVVDRPFVLSRAMFVGTQRAGAIWTGDNKADWDHMEFSVPMLLSIGVSGVPNIGADVGGFFGNPEIDLLVRWYQHGCLQPFFRAHAHIDAKRREPWLFGDVAMNRIRTALRLRYRVLPYIYTLFREAHESGNPVMRPLFWEFPGDEELFGEQKQWMLGSAFMAASIAKPGLESTTVTFPKDSIWYRFPFAVHNFNTLLASQFPVYRAGAHEIKATLDDGIPLFLRAGQIVLTRERARRNSVLAAKDPYTMYIAVAADGTAKGTHYDDDGRSFEGAWTKTAFAYESGVLGAKTAGEGNFSHEIERIVILRPDGSAPTHVKKPGFKTGETWVNKI